MRATKVDSSIESCDKIAVTTETLQSLLDCGRQTAVQIGSHAGAKLVLGRRVLWSVSLVRKYIDEIAS